MSDLEKTMICKLHGKSHATFICHHLAHGSGVGFYYGNEDDIRPDAWCYECDQRLMQNNSEWNDEIESLAKVTAICANCYDDVRMQNELPNKRIPPHENPIIEEDGWELSSAVRMNRLYSETFKIPLESEVSKLKMNDSVKLLFAFEDGDKTITFERLWVKIISVNKGKFVGLLEAAPVKIAHLKRNTEIVFKYEHIASIILPRPIKKIISSLFSSPKVKLSSMKENDAYY